MTTRSLPTWTSCPSTPSSLCTSARIRRRARWRRWRRAWSWCGRHLRLEQQAVGDPQWRRCRPRKAHAPAGRTTEKATAAGPCTPLSFPMELATQEEVRSVQEECAQQQGHVSLISDMKLPKHFRRMPLRWRPIPRLQRRL